MAADAPTLLPATSPGRRRKDGIARGVIVALTLVALVPLVLVVIELLVKGFSALSLDFFTTDPTGSFLGDPGGIKSAILGTVEMVALASAIAIPIGIAVAVYLVEFGKGTRFAAIVRYFVDVLTGVPSIVFGLFVYTALVVSGTGGSSFAGWKGSLALALLMLPVVTRSAEVVLSLVPNGLREAALALGAPRWVVTVRIVLRTAIPGLVTGSLLAVARAMGETAPLLYTVSFVLGTSFNLNGQVNSLPLQIYNDVSQPNDALVTRAWGAALTLVVMILILTLVARFIQRRSSFSS